MHRALVLAVALVLVPCAGWPQGGEPIGPEFRVNTYTTDSQAEPVVAADSAGNFVVVWGIHYFPTTFASLSGQRYASSGTPLGSEFVVANNPPGNLYFPAVAADSAGNFVVVWALGLLTGSQIRGQRYASSGTPLGSEFGISSGFGPTLPGVAADAAGNFVVVWAQPYMPPSDIFARRYAGSGAPVIPPFRVNTATTGHQTYPDVAADSAGNFVVVWSGDGPGDASGVFARRYASSGSALGPEFRVNTYTTGSQLKPSVAAGSSGDFVIVWESGLQDGSVVGVFGQRYASSGAPLGSEFRVNTYTTNVQYRPSVAADSAGNFVVIWQSSNQDGDNWGVFGQRYASSGAPVGPEFRVNTYTTNAQMEPSVAADSSGDFVVVWESDLQDGSGAGVFGQRYSMIVPVELMQFGVE